MHEYDEAIKCFKKALLKDPNQPEIRERLAYAFFNLGKIEEAIKYLQEELSLFPEDTGAYDLLVYILFKSNRIEEASNLFERLNLKLEAPSEPKKNNGLGDFILGFYFKKNGDFKKAKDYFIRARFRGYNPIKCNIQIEDMALKEKSSLSIEVFKEPTKSCGEKAKGIFYDGILCISKS